MSPTTLDLRFKENLSVKGYVIVDERNSQPLYICFSKSVAEKAKKNLDMITYIQEVPFWK